MIPILYDKNETAFISNGLGRLRDCISCVVTEERNGVYECDFEYPVDGANYTQIECGKIIGVTHDEKGDVQPFDIVGYSRPINGVVTFHCVHISYRQTALTVTGSNINSLADAFNLFASADPDNPFSYWTDISSSNYFAAADSVPHSVRQMLGGMEGSVLDSYGGEFEWDKWTVKLWSARGTLKNFTIRYGVNLTDYSDEMDYSDTYNSVIPYWLGQDNDGNDIVIKGDMQTASYPSFNSMGRCIPLDVTDKFDAENGQPTKAQVEAEGLAYINDNQTYMPSQTIKVDFVRITDTPEYAQFAQLQKCGLCDSINVEFPQYGMTGQFKIVKTTYDVLRERYNTLELGGLNITLSEALGINQEAANRLRISAGGSVTDVKQNGTSVVTAGIANVTVPTTASDIGAVPDTRTVNGKALSSNISLTASDVGALSTSTTYVSSFNGNSGAVTYTAPVTSVNSQTGAVSLTATDVGALPDSTAIHNVPSGGTTGQVLTKSSNTDYDVAWAAGGGGGGGSLEFIQARMSGSQSISTSTTVCNFNTVVRSNGTALTLNTSTHEIVVGSGINFVEISGSIWISAYGTANLKNVYMYLNSTEISTTLIQPNANYLTMILAPRIVAVSQGDKITIRAKSGGGTMTINTDGVGSTDSFIVKAVG